MAGRSPPDGGGVGVRGARAEVDASTRGATRSTASVPTSSTAPLPSRSAAIRPVPAGWVRWTCRATPWSGSPTGSTPPTTRRAPATDPTGPPTGEVKVEKGGWWGSNEFVARSAYRHYEDPPTYGDKHIGFRIVSPVSVPTVVAMGGGGFAWSPTTRCSTTTFSSSRGRLAGASAADLLPRDRQWRQPSLRRQLLRGLARRSEASHLSPSSTGPSTTSRHSCSTRTSSTSGAATPRTCSRSGASTASTGPCGARGSRAS